MALELKVVPVIALCWNLRDFGGKDGVSFCGGKRGTRVGRGDDADAAAAAAAAAADAAAAASPPTPPSACPENLPPLTCLKSHFSNQDQL